MPGVIRRNIPVQTSVLSLDNLERQAAEILSRAEKAANDRCRDLQKQAEAGIQNERERGFQQGLAEGRKAGLEETRAAANVAIEQARKDARSGLASLTQALQAALSEVNDHRHRLYADAERGLIQLSLAIAKRVCGEVVRQSSQPAIETTVRLLDLVRHAHDVELQVNPSELELLKAVAAEFVEKSDALEHVRVFANVDISRGGACLIGALGTIDATVETQLDRITAALLDLPGSTQLSTSPPDRVTDSNHHISKPDPGSCISTPESSPPLSDEVRND